MQAILIIILYIITAGFAYSVYKDIKRPPETARPEPENRPPGPQKQNRRQLEKVAASCLYRLLTPNERENINIFSFCRDASDAELINIIERFKNEY